ncbi:GNAT family N-acetyltransferase [Nocardioides mangrovi]|uniref:GNAT family N-acetyltransferase n=1 Tax=Nocardioides mangrovi TaxID=2874580 RepID=A0ABS7UD97_9ACTN|nr:GNAT family N-acetyltransferase [Nocardioides mangrovi]MBZ5738681.1 GNAT family N-acetyltransferase [Nocardioides mangrovi]
MEVLGLGWRTDLALLRLGGSEVVDRSTYAVVRTPDNPTYRWGNFLLLRRTPLARDIGRIDELFAAELPDITHRAVGVDLPDGSIGDLRALADVGYAVSGSVVMTASALREPRRPNRTALLRALVDDGDWAQRVQLDLACHDGSSPEFVEFSRLRAEAERRLTEAGTAVWFGAFDNERLVATLGVVRAGDGLIRYQEVQTHPETRGRGLAGTLVHAAGTFALRELDAHTLVIVADPDHHAIRIYRALGFEGTETQLQAELTRPSPAGPRGS